MNTDVAVIGGGLAGSFHAISAAALGRRVQLFEREAGPHDKVCGEFLSHEAQDALRGCGIDAAALGAVPVEMLRLVAGRSDILTRLPFRGMSLSRRVLDAALLDRAEAGGVRVCRGRRVDALARHAQGWRLRLADEGFDAEQAVLATGKHDLRGWRRPAGRQGDLIGLKMYFRLQPPQLRALQGSTELFLFPGGYAGLQLVEVGRANLCLVIRQSRFAALGHRWGDVLAAITAGTPLLRTRLMGAEPEWRKPLAIAGIPYGLLADGTASDPWRIGDQAAVIPSFSGDGMAIALHSASRAAASLGAGENSARFQARLAGELRGQIRLASLLSRLCVHRPAQRLLLGAARLAPSALGMIAERTRLPDHGQILPSAASLGA